MEGSTLLWKTKKLDVEICYEFNFPRLSRAMYKINASLLINITTDARLYKYRGPYFNFLSVTRRSISVENSKSTEKMISKEATAEIVGLIEPLMPSHICFGNVTALAPLIKIAITTSSKEVIKANSAPVMTPGRIKGKVTFRNVIKRLAPKLRAALSKVMSKPCKVAVTLTTTKGSAKHVCAITNPHMVPIK